MIISPENTTYKFMLKFPTPPPLSGNSNCKCDRALTQTGDAYDSDCAYKYTYVRITCVRRVCVRAKMRCTCKILFEIENIKIK